MHAEEGGKAALHQRWRGSACTHTRTHKYMDKYIYIYVYMYVTQYTQYSHRGGRQGSCTVALERKVLYIHTHTHKYIHKYIYKNVYMYVTHYSHRGGRQGSCTVALEWRLAHWDGDDLVCCAVMQRGTH